jgi:hypothetical protein
MSVYRETFHAHVECRDIKENFCVIFITFQNLFFS